MIFTKEPPVTVDQGGRAVLRALYLDYYNNYLTVDCYANHNALTREQAEVLINLARDVANSKHPEA